MFPNKYYEQMNMTGVEVDTVQNPCSGERL